MTVQNPGDTSPLADALRSTGRAITQIREAMAALQALLLTGRPAAIADAVAQVDAALVTIEPALAALQSHLHACQVGNLPELAMSLRRCGAHELAREVDDVSLDLRHVVAESISGHRRAEGLARSLTATLRQLHAAGAITTRGLLAEA